MRTKVPPYPQNIINPWTLTPEQDVALLAKFQADPRKFIEAFLQIKDKETQKFVPFRFNEAQVHVYNTIQDLRSRGVKIRLVIPKARQLGISTLIEALLYCMARLNGNVDCLIVSHDIPAAENVFRIFQNFYDMSPDEVRPMRNYRRRDQLTFANPDDKTRAQYPGLRSEVRVACAKGEVATGFTIMGAHLSEVSKWPESTAHDTMLSIMQTVPRTTDSMVFVESTPKGAQGLFYELCNMAGSNKSEWTLVFLPFHCVSEYETDLTAEELQLSNLQPPLTKYERQLMAKTPTYHHEQWLRKLKWRRRTIINECNNSVIKFNQEYPPSLEEAFMSRGESSFDLNALAWYASSKVPRAIPRRGDIHRDQRNRVYFLPDTCQCDDPDHKHPRGPLTVYRPPEPGTMYAGGADGALGSSVNYDHQDFERRQISGSKKKSDSDFSAAVFLDWKGRQVCEFHSRVVEPTDFADKLALIGYWYKHKDYGPAMLYPEVGNQAAGYGIIERLKQINYPNIGHRMKNNEQGVPQPTVQLGWVADQTSVPILISKLLREVKRGADMLSEDLISKGDRGRPKLSIYSSGLLGEMSVYQINAAGYFGAKRGQHDDRVRALGLALLALEQLPAQMTQRGLGKTDDMWYNDSEYLRSSGYPGWLHA